MADDFDSDAMLAFFGQMGKEVDGLKTRITSLSEAGSAMKKMTDETERFGQTIQRHTRGAMRGMEGAASHLATVIGGAGGLAAMFVGAAKSLDAFAVGALQNRNFAINTGFAGEALKKMRLQMSAAGISANEASQGIGNIGAKLQEVLALQETSGFYRSLQASSPALAEQVRQLMNAGDQQGALNVLQEAYNNGGERFKAWLPTVTGMTRAQWESQKVGLKGLIEPWKISKESALEYHKTMVNLETIFDGVWKSVSASMLEGILKLTGTEGGMEGLNKKAKAFAEGFKKYFDGPVMDTLKTTYREAKFIIDVINKYVPADLTVGKLATAMKQQPSGIEGYTAKSGAGIGPMQGMVKFYDWFTKLFSTEAHAGEYEPGATLLQQETEKDSSKILADMRDIFVKWDDELVGGGIGGGWGGKGGMGGGGDGASPESGQGGPARLNDEGGKVIDADTMKQAEMLGRAGDVAGLQRLFAQRGYKMSGPACGIVASGYVKSAGFKPPPGGAIATSWHKWGEASTKEGINEPGHPFGSMVATYWHGRYGGTQGQILAPGARGGHVMTIVPGTYDPKTNTADMVDQYGYSHGKRTLNDLDIRYAGAEAVAAVEAARGNQRDKVDKAITPKSDVWSKASANVNINLNNVPAGVKTDADIDGGVFKTLKLNRSNQVAYE